jgi:hypothetical protein
MDPTSDVGRTPSPVLRRDTWGGANEGLPRGLESSSREGRIRALRSRRMVRDLEQFLAVHLDGFVQEANSAEAGDAFASN